MALSTNYLTQKDTLDLGREGSGQLDAQLGLSGRDCQTDLFHGKTERDLGKDLWAMALKVFQAWQLWTHSCRSMQGHLLSPGLWDSLCLTFVGSGYSFYLPTKPQA